MYGIAVLGVLSYFAWQTYPVFRAPRLAVLEPGKDMSVTDPRIMLRGSTDPGARLTVNREEVYVDGDGNYAQPMVLMSGLNVIDIAAEGRFGRKTKLTRYIIYQPHLGAQF